MNDERNLPLPTEPQECRRAAEDTTRDRSERLIWALLAIAGELHGIRRDRRK
ncbi:hypothetical protein [Streptomyces sp. NPDC059278]|uniref:hypothetical protein n=1 Tax=Streptomyces sp. NPDC059278 TaxID=3346801 RepID=UPI0036812023